MKLFGNHKKENKTGGGTRAILMSGLSLAVVMTLLGYSAYGWFTMTKDVRAMGMELTVQAQNGLQISLDPQDPDGWKETVTVPMNQYVDIAGYAPDEDDFYLLPSSSYSGFNGEIFTSDNINGFIPIGGDWSGVHLQQATAGYYDAIDAEYQGCYVDVPLYFRYNYGMTAFDLFLSNNTTSILPVASKIANTVRIAFLDDEDRSLNSMGENDPDVHQLIYSNRITAPSVISDITGGNVTLKPPLFLTYDEDTGLSNEQLLRCESGVEDNNYACLVARIWVEGQDEDCVDEIGRQEFFISLGFHAEPDYD